MSEIEDDGWITVSEYDEPAKIIPEMKKLAETKTVFDEGVKFDIDKIRMELLPPELMTAVATILTFGATKYTDRNWEKGMKWSRVYGALLRHLVAWSSGEKTDPETGKSHLWHAGCCIAFLITYEMREVGENDIY